MIQSIDRAFKILELYKYNNNSDLGVSEISKLLNLSKSTTYGIVNSLYQLGYLEQNPSNSKYYLGLKFFAFQEIIRPHSNLVNIVHPYLESLVDKFNETAHFAYKINNRVMYLDKVDCDEELFFKTAIGKENYLHSTAVGKCILANQIQDEIDHILKEDLVELTEYTITNKDDLLKELKKIKAKGYAVDNQEGSIGLVCYAVPVFINGKCNSAISVSSPTLRINEEKHSEIIKSLSFIRDELKNKYN